MRLPRQVFSSLLLFEGAILLGAQTANLQRMKGRSDAALLANNPTYSEAVLKGRHPEDLLSEREAALSREQTEYAQFKLLPGVAKAALEAGKIDKARQFAQKALSLSAKYDQPRKLSNGDPISDAGDAVFICHMVPGRVALLRGDVDSAKEALLLSATTHGSITLDIAGPNMSLARELLKISGTDVVLQFLDACHHFWKQDAGKIDRWSAEIRAGNLPDFDTNLF
jgi:hypothetical protein